MEYHRQPPFHVAKVVSPPLADRLEARAGTAHGTKVAARAGEDDHLANFAGSETTEPPRLAKHCFAESEIAEAQVPAQPTLPATVIEAIERSVGFDGAGFFTNRKERRGEVTGTAYALLHAMQAGGDTAIKLAINRFPPDLRQRAPSASKPELLAVQLTAKPRTTEERKACSALASLLIVAQAEGVSVERYREWANGIDLADAEFRARKIRAALKVSAPDEFEGDQAPTPPVYELQIAVLVDGKPNEAVRVVIEDHRAGEVRASIAQAKATGELTKLAEDLDNLAVPGHRQANID